MSAYAEHWLREIAVTIKPKTQKSYGSALRLHILPALGSTKVRMLQKGRIKSFLVERLRQGKVRTIAEGEVTKEVRLPLARDSVRIIHATLRALLNAAVDDGVIITNPADKLGRTLRLVVNAKTRQEEVKAMTRDQLGHSSPLRETRRPLTSGDTTRCSCSWRGQACGSARGSRSSGTT